MKNKFLKLILSIILILSFIVPLTSCVHPENTEVPSTAVQTKEQTNRPIYSQISVRMDFPPSLNEFHDKITEGKLTSGDKWYIARAFERDENGKVKILDFNRLLSPVFPESLEWTKISWLGWYNEVWLKPKKNDDEFTTVIMTCFTDKDSYDEYYNIVLTERYLQKNKKLTSDGKTVVNYSASETLLIYELELQERKMTVVKYYKGDTIQGDPYEIEVYCEQDNGFFVLNLNSIKKDYPDSYFLEYDVELYVDDSGECDYEKHFEDIETIEEVKENDNKSDIKY